MLQIKFLKLYGLSALLAVVISNDCMAASGRFVIPRLRVKANYQVGQTQGTLLGYGWAFKDYTSQKSYLVTAAHVVAGAKSIELNDAEEMPKSIANNFRFHKVVALSETLDVALLELSEKSAIKDMISLEQILRFSHFPLPMSGEVDRNFRSLFLTLNWKISGSGAWSFRSHINDSNSPLFPLYDWVEVQNTEIRPGISGFLLNTQEKYPRLLGMILKAQVGGRSAAVISFPQLVSVLIPMIKGVDPWRKKFPTSAYISSQVVHNSGVSKVLFRQKSIHFPAHKNYLSITLKELCPTSAMLPVGDWRDGGGSNSATKLIEYVGQKLEIEHGCNENGLVLPNGQVITGFRSETGRWVRKESIEDLKKERLQRSILDELLEEVHFIFESSGVGQ